MVSITIPWLAFWNLGLFALSICILAGCRSNMERNYSLVNWPRSTIDLIWGEECAAATVDIIPDLYKFGASGLCRVTDGETSCKRQFPPTFNLAEAVLQDLENANSTAIEECREAIDKPVNHGTAKKLGTAMVSFLIAWIFLNIISLVVAIASGSAITVAPTAVLVVDALLIFTSLALCIAMMNFEGGGYLKNVRGQEFSDREMIGIALWMLLGMLVGRALSNLWLTVGSLAILLPIALVYVLFLVRTRGFFAVVRAAVAEDTG
ncbi:hypothetical protein F66182_8015 [Fusarium sp. NRRL 66182]|nr:hypothetical protein F66182_8015 [Fusarium sp. NRRL 66182]